MVDRHSPDALATEFRRERSIRRTVKVLDSKRRQIRADLEQIVKHMALLLPAQTGMDATILQEAANRLGDESFAQLLLQILQK